MKKNIALIIRTLGTGGAEKQCLLLAKRLQEDFNVYLFVQIKHPKDLKKVKIIEKEKINYIQLNGNLLVRTKQLVSSFKKNNIDIAFSYLTIDNIILSLSKLLYPKTIIVGGIRSSLLPKSKFLINRFLHKFFFRYTIFNNYSGKNFFLEKGFNRKKTIVIPNSINLPPITPERQEKDQIKILSVGRFVQAKDYFTALKSFSKLLKTFKQGNLKYLIVGYGELEEEIRNYIETNKIENVELVIDPPDVDVFYLNSDIYLCTSIFEGLSNTLMEAASFSLPIVATNVGDNKCIVENEKNGFLVKVGDYRNISDTLLKLANDRIKRLEFGYNSRKLIEQKYSETAMKQNYVKLINQILDV